MSNDVLTKYTKGGYTLAHPDVVLLSPEKVWRACYPTPMPGEYRELVMEAIEHVVKSGVFTGPAMTLERIQNQIELRLPRGGPPVLGLGR